MYGNIWTVLQKMENGEDLEHKIRCMSERLDELEAGVSNNKNEIQKMIHDREIELDEAIVMESLRNDWLKRTDERKFHKFTRSLRRERWRNTSKGFCMSSSVMYKIVWAILVISAFVMAFLKSSGII